MMLHERLREHRKSAQEIDLRYNDANKRLHELRNSGVQGQSAQQIVTKLQDDIRSLKDRFDNV